MPPSGMCAASGCRMPECRTSAIITGSITSIILLPAPAAVPAFLILRAPSGGPQTAFYVMCAAKSPPPEVSHPKATTRRRRIRPWRSFGLGLGRGDRSEETVLLG